MSSISLRARLTAGLVAGAMFASSGCGSSSGAAGEGSLPPAAGPNMVTAADIESNPGQPLDRLLAARVSGLRITRTSGGEMAIQIRGATSRTEPSWPLYVVDDMPIDAGPEGEMPSVSLDNIASIQILKDPGSTAMYGMRGGAGVVVIRTKRARQ